MKKLALTVGNGMMGDDAAGPLLARMMRLSPIEGWEALDGGSVPENVLHIIRAKCPEEVLVIDAADMDLAPGEVRYISPERIGDPFFMNTHALPLSYLVQSLKEFVPKVELLGIQPEVVAFGYPLTPTVREAVGRVYESLKEDDLEWDRL
jgi:hydrogenase 3 maturation protease